MFKRLRGDLPRWKEVCMTVARILAAKGHDVVVTQPNRSLTEVANILRERGIGALVVTNADDEVLGIISERDLVRAIAEHGAAALESPLSRHMTAKVVTVDENASIETVMDMMTEGRFRHVPVVKNGRLAGLVSIGDVVKHRIAVIETEHQALREYIATA
jgi:CBS domain-containing protein